MAVRGFFRGFPSSIADARDLLDGRSVAPAFDVWCGAVSYVDFTNGTVLDSFGRKAPTVLCLPFFDPTRASPPHFCEPVRGLPQSDYYQGGGLVLRIEGSLALRQAGDYTFAWGHDDGVSFRFGETAVFEYPDPTGSRVDRRVVRAPAAGLYPFTLEWYDTIGGALIDWYVARGDASTGALDWRFSLVSRGDLFPSSTAPCTSRCERCEGATSVCDRNARRCVECLSDSHCPACEACLDRRCVPAWQVPGADAAVGCPAAPPDASAVGANDAQSSDAESAITPPVATPGCGCRTGSLQAAGRGATLLAVLAAMLRRRRSAR